MKRFLLCTLLWTSLLFSSLAFAEEPILVIDPQGHADVITEVIFTPDGKTLISVAQDKTIRLWDVESGELVKTIRGQIGKGQEGILLAGALSPDGKILAVGGDLSYNNDNGYGKIRLYDLETGEQIGLLTGHEDTVQGLAFSPDGKWLASGSYDNTLRVLDLSSLLEGAKQGKTSGTTLKGHTGCVTSVAFSPDGKKLVSASYDGTLRLWKMPKDGRGFKNLASLLMKKHTNKVGCVAYSPDGKYIVSGGYDRKILLWDGEGKFLKEIAEYSGDVETVSFSADSQKIVIGGKENFQVLVYAIPSGEKITTFTQYSDTVFASAFYGNNWIATSGGDNEIHIWDATTGTIKTSISGKGKPVWTVMFADDSKIAFGTTNLFSPRIDDPSQNHPDHFPLEKSFDFRELSLSQHAFVENHDTRTNTEYHGKKLTYLNKFELSVTNGVKIKNDPDLDGWIRAYTFTNEGNIIVGSSYSLKLYRSDGTLLRTYVGHTGEVWAVSISADGRLLASAGNDQTIKLWSLTDEGEFPSVLEWFTDPSWQDYFRETRMEKLARQKSRSAWEKIIAKMKADQDKDYQLLEDELVGMSGLVSPLATLFVASDNEWVYWTPQGYYAASAGGEQYIGWQINQGNNKTAEFYPVSVFRKQFLNPELVKKTIALGSFKYALEELNAESRKPVTERAISDVLPPKVEWLMPKEPTLNTTQNPIRIQAAIRSNSDITEIKVLVNGRPRPELVEGVQATGRGLVLSVPTPVTDRRASAKEKMIDQEVTLTPGKNTIAIFAANENAGVTSDERIIQYYESGEEEWLKPNLYMVSIGVSQYQRSALRLEYADADAQAISQLFRAQEGKLYKTVSIKELDNENATRDNILDALDWLEKETTQKDVAVIFIASHGQNDERGNFYILPTDGDPDKLRRTGVDWSDFREILGNLPSRVLLFVDTCHSGQLGKNLYTLRGQIDNTEAIRELASDENGVVILAASTGKEFSMERPDWGHGAFTKALLDAMEAGNADLNQDGIISLQELDYYVSERVKELTNGVQHPTTLKPSTISRFPIVQVK
jgi:WD40 repeat protein